MIQVEPVQGGWILERSSVTRFDDGSARWSSRAGATTKAGVLAILGQWLEEQRGPDASPPAVTILEPQDSQERPEDHPEPAG